MKISPCLLGFGFLGASFYTSLAKENPAKFLALETSLDDSQKTIYGLVKAERLRLYLTGLTLGTLISLAFLYYNPPKSLISTICLFVTISWTICIAFYMLMRKSTYMIQHLTSQDQVNKWLDVYRDMQWRWIVGFILGIVGYSLLCYGFFEC